jgi:CheY-like chemotaxis protein
MFMKNSDGLLCALLVGEYRNDRRVVREVFRRSGWELHEVGDGREALERARQDRVHVVIAESTGWEDLLAELHRLPQPPQLVVTSRTADDYLWAAVLNHGGFDVLPQPLDGEELERVVAAAGRQALSAPMTLSASAAGSPLV